MWETPLIEICTISINAIIKYTTYFYFRHHNRIDSQKVLEKIILFQFVTCLTKYIKQNRNRCQASLVETRTINQSRSFQLWLQLEITLPFPIKIVYKYNVNKLNDRFSMIKIY